MAHHGACPGRGWKVENISTKSVKIIRRFPGSDFFSRAGRRGGVGKPGVGGGEVIGLG